MDVDVSSEPAFGDLLLELRLGRGLSQEELAAEAKVSVRAISDLERGVTRRPHRDTIRALAAALGLAAGDRAVFERLARQAPPVRPPRREGQRIDLPSPPTPLVGRADDVAALVRLVRSPGVRLVTITGLGGVGKTRLAVEVAWRLAAAFTGVHLVDLSALRAPDEVPAAIAAALGLPASAAGSVTAIAARVADTQRLLLLDCAERVDCAPELARLLAAGPGLTLLVTSRQPLRLRGEHLWPLGPLPLPDLASAATNAALALLVERIHAVRPGFALTPDNTGPLVALCRRLDGLPLAIELAAARLRTREPAELLAELGLAGLRAEAVDVPDRQRSLAATVAWTVDQLGAPERAVLAGLTAFAGGAAPAHLRRVLAGAEVDRAVSVLVDAHIVTVVDRAGQARLTMLDTIREAAGELLSDVDVRAAHAACFLDLLTTSPQPGSIDAELDNVRAAVDWALREAPERLDTAAVTALAGYLTGRGYLPEAYRVLRAIAGRTPHGGAQAHAWRGAGIAANEQGDPAAAVALANRAVAGFAAIGDDAGRCAALALLGNARKALGEYARARATHEECLALARALGDARTLTVALNNLGTLAEDLGDYASARAHYAESLAIKERHGDGRGIAVAHNNLGGLAAELGDHATARAHLTQAASGFRARGDEPALAFSLAMLAQAELAGGDRDAAARHAAEALHLARGVEFGHGIGLALARLGDIARQAGDAATAREHYRGALEQPIGLPETIRTLERLAAASLHEPAQARALLDEADRLRTAHALPPSPTARPVIDTVRSAL